MQNALELDAEGTSTTQSNIVHEWLRVCPCPGKRGNLETMLLEMFTFWRENYVLDERKKSEIFKILLIRGKSAFSQSWLFPLSD